MNFLDFLEKLKGENKHLECASVYEKFLNVIDLL